MLNLVILFLVTFCAVNADETLQVIRSEMSLEMEKFAFVTAVDLLEKGQVLGQIGTELEEAMNNKYGEGWMTLVGKDLTKIQLSKNLNGNTILLMRYQDEEMFLSQWNIAQNNSTKCDQVRLNNLN